MSRITSSLRSTVVAIYLFYACLNRMSNPYIYSPAMEAVNRRYFAVLRRVGHRVAVRRPRKPVPQLIDCGETY
jgi:hypothetical protein